MTRLSPPAIARQIAAELLRAGCVHARADTPFRQPSGWASPVYMDCRRIIAYPALRRLLVKQGLAQLREAGALDGIDAIVGAETSGIALAAWMADALELPLHYVRKKSADTAPAALDDSAEPAQKASQASEQVAALALAQIGGALQAGSRVLLVDDLMAGGQSKLHFCQTLTAAGAQLNDMFIIFDYGVFPTHGLLSPAGVRIHALACWRDVLDAVMEMTQTRDTAPPLPALRQQFSPAVIKQIEAFLDDPAAWSEAHGGRTGY